MHRWRWFSLLAAASFVLIILRPMGAPAQQVRVGNQGAVAIGDAAKAAIIDSVSKALNDVYVFPDVAEQMEKKLRANLCAKAYSKIDTYGEFTSRLTEDLMEVAHDKHLRILYSPEAPPGSAHEDSLTEDEERELVERRAHVNFGFTKIERLPGNVGYLDLRNFHDAAWAGRTAVAAPLLWGRTHRRTRRCGPTRGEDRPHGSADATSGGHLLQAVEVRPCRV